jgi:hypothetical protein
LLQPILELSRSKLGSSKKGQHKKLSDWPPTFGTKSWRLSTIFLFRPLLKLSNLELKSFKKGWRKFSCFGQAPKNPKKLMNFKILQKFKANKHKRKSLKGKEWSLETYLKLLCLCVPHLLQE